MSFFIPISTRMHSAPECNVVLMVEHVYNRLHLPPFASSGHALWHHERFPKVREHMILTLFLEDLPLDPGGHSLM